MLRANYSAEGVCYTTVRWRRMTALRVLAAGGRLFGQASIIRNLDRLATIDLGKSRNQLKFSRLIWKLDPSVVDAVRIVCCFENLFKARLLLSGFVVHEVDRKAAADLRIEQAKRPLLIRSLKRREGVLGRRDIDYSFNLLRPTTLGWRVLTEVPAYRRQIALPDRLFQNLTEIAASRNTLHFLSSQTVSYSAKIFEDLRYIRTCFNRHVVQRHNRLLKSLGFPDVHLLQKLG